MPGPASWPRASPQNFRPAASPRITQPVLVLSGDEDPIVRPAVGRALARAVAHGRFVLVHRMGHMFSAPLWPELVSEIDRLAT